LTSARQRATLASRAQSTLTRSVQLLGAMLHKLLLADDSVTIQRVIELTFADEDMQVIAVGGRERSHPPHRIGSADIVLADVGMPEMDGYEVAAYVKNTPHLAHIPVLLLTGAFRAVDEKSPGSRV